MRKDTSFWESAILNNAVLYAADGTVDCHV